MKRQAVILLTLVLIATIPAMAAPLGRNLPFNAAVVAHKYNFWISGESNGSSSPNNLEIIGWFDATGSDQTNGAIAAGRAEVSMDNAPGVYASISMPLATSEPNNIQVFDGANGVYSLFIRFDQLPNSCAMSMKLIVDDIKGQSGRIEGTYSCTITPAVFGGGVLHGEIKARN